MIVPGAYERRARLAPGLCALAPISVVILGLGANSDPVVAGVSSLLVAIGGPMVLASFVRDRGAEIEPGLYEKWGGPPTRRFLRLAGDEQASAQVAAWRAGVERATGQALPDRRAERANSAKADQALDVVVARVRTLTRDRVKHPLLFHENCNYGFWRNLRGMRWIGLSIAVVCQLAILVAVIAGVEVDRGVVLASMVNAAFALLWLFLPTEAAVRRASERYARQLLDSAIDL